MTENTKTTTEFLQKLAPCIERGDLDACMEEAARVAGEIGIGAGEVFDLSVQEQDKGNYAFTYVLALAVAQGLEGKVKANAHYIAGLAAQVIEKTKESEEHYKKAIEIDPDYTAAHRNYAILLQKQHRRQEAEENYKKVIELYPGRGEVHNNYANLLREKGRFSEAEKEVRIALQIQPKNPDAFGTYGDILADEDYLEEAIEKYREAIKKFEKSTEHRSQPSEKIAKIER